MRIAVVGVGGIGGYFGGVLARAGSSVAFVARGRQLEALRADGLRVDRPDGGFHLERVEATGQPQEIGMVDAIIVAVKAWQVPEVAPTLGPLVGDGTAFLPLQNGVEAAGQLAAVHGDEHVMGGTTVIL